MGIENKANPEAGEIQKDYLSLQDVDFPDKEREQFFGHGDPNQPTTSNNQVHIQFENDGAVRSIIQDSNDEGLNGLVITQETSESLILDDGNWHHLVVSTREDGYQGYNVYIDGALEASSPRGEGDSNPDDSEVWIAAGGDPIDPLS